jgi:hypothetical protein
MQLVPQLIPDGSENIVPVPVPFFVTLSIAEPGSLSKIAVTVVSSQRSTMQSADPVQLPPLHPAKAEPACGTADNKMLVPHGYREVQSAALQVTVPFPLPPMETAKEGLGEETSKVAVTVWFEVTVTVHEALAVGQRPPQLLNVLFGFGSPIKVTTVPDPTVTAQLVPQITPVGFEVIVPVPPPSFVIVKVNDTGGLATGEVPESDPSPQAAINMAMHTTERGNLLFGELKKLRPVIRSTANLALTDSQTLLNASGSVFS